jgi:hypothetical protein
MTTDCVESSLDCKWRSVTYDISQLAKIVIYTLSFSLMEQNMVVVVTQSS